MEKEEVVRMEEEEEEVRMEEEVWVVEEGRMW